MHALARRLHRIEIGQGHTQPGTRIGAAHQALARFMLSARPDLRLVAPCDTDPITFASIRVLLAWAEGDEQAAAKWDRAQPLPPSPPPPPLPPQRPNEADRAYLARCAASLPSVEQSRHLEDQAILAARARITRAKETQS